METFRQDLKLALRNLRSHRGSSTLIVASLALALAGNSTFFSIVSAMMIRPLPYPEPEQLAFVWQVPRQTPDEQGTTSAGNFLDWRSQATSFTALEAFENKSYNLSGVEQPEEVAALAVTPGALNLLGARPLHGRTFIAADGEPGSPKVAVLSYKLWRDRFGADPAIVGQSVTLDDVSHTVVGILPEELEFLGNKVGLWTPRSLIGEETLRGAGNLIVMGRLKPRVESAEADAEMGAIAQRLEQQFPENVGLLARVRTLREQIPGPTDRQLFALMQGAMFFVLLIACANIANMLLARGQDRQREIALRATLGANRGRVLRQLLTESLLLAALGGALGLALSAWGIELMAKQLSSELPRALMPRLDPNVIAFSATITVLAGLLFGILPALRASKARLAVALAETARGTTSGVRRQWLSRGLVAAQMMLAVVLLCGTGLLVKAMIYIQVLDPGFDTRNLLTFRVSLPPSRYANDEATDGFFRELEARLASLPTVAAVSASPALPRGRNNPTAAFTLDGREVGSGEAQPVAVTLAVLPSYFDTLKIPLLAGRKLGGADDRGASPVVAVSQAFARQHFPDGDAVGHRLTVEGRSREIVGVVGDVVQGRMLEAGGVTPILYLPQAQSATRALYFLVRSEATQKSLADQVRATVWALDGGLPVAQIKSLEEHVREQFVGARLLGTLVGGFGALALLLAAIGLYGVISYSVSQRTREIGIRMAMGAERGRVLAQVARQGLILAGVGFVCASPFVVLVTKQITGILGNATGLTLATLPWTTLLLALVATVASLVPAKRAAELDPVEALRRDS